MSSFQQFLPPKEWELRDGKLMFLSENQGVCDWGVDTSDQVWMELNDSGFNELGIQLPRFLTVVRPYQLAQGGWPNCAVMDVDAPETVAALTKIAQATGLPLIAAHDGLTIFGKGPILLWALSPLPHQSEGQIFLTGRDKPPFRKLARKLDFVEL